MPGLVLEGGTLRPVFSCGVMDALLDEGLMFDYVIGVSAGITYAFSYLSKQRGRNLEVFTRYRNDKRYLSLRNYPKCRSMFGLEFVFDEIPNKLLPFDWDTFHAYQGKVLVGVTNAVTGQAEYFDGMQLDLPCTMLRATCAIPFYFPAIPVDGTLYYDGGLADSIPIVRALHDGSRKNLIVLTRPAGYQKKVSAGTYAAARALHHKYPNLSATMLGRAKKYNDTRCFCGQLARKQPENTVVLQPAYPLRSFEKDVNTLKQNYQHGYDTAMAQMPQIKALFA